MNKNHLSRNLTCPLCLGFLNQPTLLPCNHIFCNSCVPNRTNFGAECPLCTIQVPDRDLRHAPFMESIVAIYKSMKVTYRTNSSKLELKFMTSPNESFTNSIICAFCQFYTVSEVTGPMLHYSKGKLVEGDEAFVSDVIHVHKICMDWAPQVFFEEDTVKNLKVEVTRGARLKCTKCGIKGAALGCFVKSCRRSYHVTCAIETSKCRWDYESFLLLCPAHCSVKFPNEKLNPKKHKKCQLSDSRVASNGVNDWVLCPSGLSSEQKVASLKLFTLLEEEEKAVIKRAFAVANWKKVLVIHENANLQITGELLQCLRPRRMLNDEVINVYLELLKEREKRDPLKLLKCHFFNTFFYKKLIGGRSGYDYKAVSRWTTKKNLGYSLIDCDKIFVPIHKELHWCLAVINKTDQKFQYLDSLGGYDTEVMPLLAKYYVDEVKEKSGKDIDVSSWKFECVKDLPKQETGFDCGVFMIKYADFYCRGLELCFHQKHMPYFRLRTAKEILQLRAD